LLKQQIELHESLVLKENELVIVDEAPSSFDDDLIGMMISISFKQRYGASQCGPLNNALNPTLGLKNSFIALIFRYIAVHNRLNPTLRLCLYQFLHTMRSWRETIHHDPQNVQ
jgi:hypothetical protein